MRAGWVCEHIPQTAQAVLPTGAPFHAKLVQMLGKVVGVRIGALAAECVAVHRAKKVKIYDMHGLRPDVDYLSKVP